MDPFEDDQLNLVDLFSDDETTRTPEGTTEVTSPDSLFDTDILDFENALELNPDVHSPMDFDSVEVMDLFESEDTREQPVLTSPPPPTEAPASSSAESQLLVQIQCQEVDELQQELMRLREEERRMAEECKQHLQNAESWRRQLDEAREGNEAREALLETQRQDIEVFKSKSTMLLKTVEQLRGNLALENAQLSKKTEELQKERSVCEQAKGELQQNVNMIRKLKQELETNKIAAKHAFDKIKIVHDYSVKDCAILKQERDLEREWIKQYKTQSEIRIRSLEEKCQRPPSNTKETQTAVKTLKDSATETLPAINDKITAQNGLAGNGSGVDGTAAIAELSSHAFLCMWEYCNLVCPNYDLLRSHMIEEHLQ